MTLEELKLIRKIIRYSYKEYLWPELEQAIFILDREIKLKELDPRKETSK